MARSNIDIGEKADRQLHEDTPSRKSSHKLLWVIVIILVVGGLLFGYEKMMQAPDRGGDEGRKLANAIQASKAERIIVCRASGGVQRAVEALLLDWGSEKGFRLANPDQDALRQAAEKLEKAKVVPADVAKTVGEALGVDVLVVVEGTSLWAVSLKSGYVHDVAVRAISCKTGDVIYSGSLRLGLR